MRLSRVLALVGVGTSLVLFAGCARSAEPVTVSRQALGTVVTITAYGSDDAALRDTVDAAFRDIARIEDQLNPYDAASAIATVNVTPGAWHALPSDAYTILNRVRTLGMGAQFSAALWGVSRLYDFTGKGSIPASTTLRAALAAARSLETTGGLVRFAVLTTGTATPGFDFGGAEKGLAMDAAMARMQKATGVTGVLVSSGSSTSVWGSKPDGTPWHVGIEDPRGPGTIIALIGATSPRQLNVSTSGDYQQYFMRDGVRYHHILDPATGTPARGLRSLTVYGAISGLDADILSKLFVAGRSQAGAYARAHGIGLLAVDDKGRVLSVAAPKSAGLTLERVAAPKR